MEPHHAHQRVLQRRQGEVAEAHRLVSEQPDRVGVTGDLEHRHDAPHRAEARVEAARQEGESAERVGIGGQVADETAHVDHRAHLQPAAVAREELSRSDLVIDVLDRGGR